MSRSCTPEREAPLIELLESRFLFARPLGVAVEVAQLLNYDRRG